MAEEEGKRLILRKMGTGIGVSVAVILALPFIVLVAPFALLIYLAQTPFERKKYKNSVYFRETREKYRWGITKETEYFFYNVMSEKGILFKREFFPNAKQVYFLWENNDEKIALIFPCFEDIYKESCWMANEDSEHSEPKELNEALKEIYGEAIVELPYPIKIAADEEVFGQEDREIALKDPIFFVFGKNHPLEEALKNAL